MYAGYESMSTIAGEIENPQVIPKATMITVPLIMAVYIFPTVAGLATLTDEKVANLLGISVRRYRMPEARGLLGH